MKRGIFITGTDTGIGKTRFSVLLIEALKRRGLKVVGMKPIATGAEMIDGRMVNDDAYQLMQQSNVTVDYELINPILFDEPVAPHIAAERQGQNIDIGHIKICYQALSSKADIVVVEGVGGWRVPLSDQTSLLNLVQTLGLPVILVVGFRLGCINHTILTVEALRSDGVELLAWAANSVEKNYLYKQQTLETLQSSLNCPMLAHLAYDELLEVNKKGQIIDLSTILA